MANPRAHTRVTVLLDDNTEIETTISLDARDEEVNNLALAYTLPTGRTISDTYYADSKAQSVKETVSASASLASAHYSVAVTATVDEVVTTGKVLVEVDGVGQKEAQFSAGSVSAGQHNLTATVALP